MDEDPTIDALERCFAFLEFNGATMLAANGRKNATAIRTAALEEAAKVCEAMGGLAEEQRKGLGIMTNYEMACAQHGKVPTINGACAAAIRALKVK